MTHNNTNTTQPRREFLTNSALTGIGVLGFTATASATDFGTVHYAEAGIEHQVAFDSLPDERYKSQDQILSEVIETTGFTRAELRKMSEAERREKVPFPGDRSKLIEPGISGSHIDHPPEVVVMSDDEIAVTNRDSTILDRMKQKDVIVNHSQAGVARDENRTLGTIISNLSGYSSPTRGYEVASTERYQLPEVAIRSGGDGPWLPVQTGAGRVTIPPGASRNVAYPSTDVELELRTRDGSPTTESVPVIPRLKMRNLGKVSVTKRGDLQ